MEVNAQDVINNLLEQNTQLTLQVAMLEAAIKTLSEGDSQGDQKEQGQE